ncbi:hypothetical protein BD410DRAFT_213336 [Rickenella mellea]|uniref:Uncharacterized protein n=1 Tax=Rickenella mellea TaxID=50990 RepID=A0A4Y7PHR0_9AGAM|nr:hypothetical protein BD410DRAFT_213336 [Rickenella mellea]
MSHVPPPPLLHLHQGPPAHDNEQHDERTNERATSEQSNQRHDEQRHDEQRRTENGVRRTMSGGREREREQPATTTNGEWVSGRRDQLIVASKTHMPCRGAINQQPNSPPTRPCTPNRPCSPNSPTRHPPAPPSPSRQRGPRPTTTRMGTTTATNDEQPDGSDDKEG